MHLVYCLDKYCCGKMDGNSLLHSSQTAKENSIQAIKHDFRKVLYYLSCCYKVWSTLSVQVLR